jgi:hypothetical protein
MIMGKRGANAGFEELHDQRAASGIDKILSRTDPLRQNGRRKQAADDTPVNSLSRRRSPFKNFLS